MITSPMAKTKPMVGARVERNFKEKIRREAKRRDRPEAYIVRELLEKGWESREEEHEGEKVPA